MKTNPIFTANISEKVAHEWLMKEWGSYEDVGKPLSGHVATVIQNSPKGKIVCYTDAEIKLLQRSANYHPGAWDSREKIVVSFMRACSRISDLIDDYYSVTPLNSI